MVSAIIISFTIPLTIGFNFFIESYSWFYKSQKSLDGIGKSIGISNMILYSSRLFNFIFIAISSYLIDTQFNSSKLFYLYVAAGLIIILSHLIFFKLKIKLKKKLSEILFNTNQILEGSGRKIFITTVFSSFMFFLSYVCPFLIASIYPNYRLTIISFGTLGNFIATVPLVFYVDRILYSSMDSNKIRSQIGFYFFGRITGFTISLFSLIIIYFILKFL